MIFETETNLYGEKALSKALSDKDTKIEVLQGKVSVIMTDAEMKEYQDGKITMSSKLSTVEQNLSGLTRQYSDLKTEYDTVSGQYTSLDSKVTTVSESVDGLSADISSVKSTADGNTTKITSLQATADGLSTSVSSAQSDITNLQSAQSKLEQTTDSISTEVSKKVGVSEVISRINQSAESVIINAAKIGLDNWTITANSITNDTGTCRVGMWNATNENKDFLVVRTANSDGSYNYPFYVRGDGTVYSSNITLKDYIYVDGNSSSYIKIPYKIGSVNATTTISKSGIDCRQNASSYSEGVNGVQIGTYEAPWDSSLVYSIPFAAYTPQQAVKYSDRFDGVTIRHTDSDTSTRVTIKKHNTSGVSSQCDIVPTSIYMYAEGYSTTSYRNDGFTVTNGTKSMAMNTEDYSTRLLYCYETASPMFGDIGEGEIAEDGLCYVMLDPVFQETIASDQSYQVFLTPYGEGTCYVKERTGNYFIVSGTAGIAFGWEVKGKQIHNSQKRLDIRDINSAESYTGVENLTNYGDSTDTHLSELKEGRLLTS